MSNMNFNYLYRDGSNYKKWGRIVFANPDGLTPVHVIETLRDEWGGDGLFLAHQIRVPEVFLYGESDAYADDHCFHEFYGVEPTDEVPSDQHGRTIATFIAEIQSEKGRSWTVFDPFDRHFWSGPPPKG